MKKAFLMLMVVLCSFPVSAQNKEDEFSIKFGGYVNWTAIYDSRQNVTAREGHFLYFPKNVQLDVNGYDVNSEHNFNMAVIQTRLSAKITGPSVLGAKTLGLIETEFMGNSDADVNGLRLRHSYLSLLWSNVELTLGQTWFPFFIPEITPQQIGTNGSAPFQPFGRSPQFRLSYINKGFKLTGVLGMQRDFQSTGPIGSSTEYLRNAVVPDMFFIAQNKFSFVHLGAGAEFKTLRPVLRTSKNFVSKEIVSSSSFLAFSKFYLSNLSWSLQGITGGNLTDLAMLGGYAVTSVDTNTMIKTYSPLKVYSLISDLSYLTDNKEFEFGLFTGYTENLGSDEAITNEIYSRGSDIANLIRIAPRVQYSKNNFRAAFEMEYTAANYGATNNMGKVIDSKKVENFRFYTSIYYFIF